MQTSKKTLNATLEKQLSNTVYQLICDIKNVSDAKLVLETILSPTELSTVIKRVSIAYWLSKNRKYDNIKNNLMVSSASIADVQKHIKTSGWQLVLKFLNADEWASIWEAKIKNVFKR
ncbi:MAG: Trp family transcriptional regulator [Candidatus Amesbacteria bacterium]|nr:Trp family transcriptional regulator [Candidatus Amesbacteria bacterium]